MLPQGKWKNPARRWIFPPFDYLGDVPLKLSIYLGDGYQ
jgi:hypothetical protein